MGSDGTDKRRGSRTATFTVGFGVFLLAAYLSYRLSKAFLLPGSGDAGPTVDTPAAGRKRVMDRPAMTGGGTSGPSQLQRLMESRVCGSPAVDGYAHVKPECLQASPTNKWWQEHKPRPDDLDIHLENLADYDGLAVGWGIGNTKASVEECAEACRQHKPPGPKGGPFGNLPCNAFAWCAHETCFEPDAHKHKKGDCWLKFTEGPASPEVNMRGRLSLAQQQRHPKAPAVVQWHAGVLLPHGVQLTNGSWGPRHQW